MLSDAKKDQFVQIMGLADSSASFLKYLEKVKISIGSKIKIIDCLEFDQSITIAMNKKEINLSERVINNLFIKLIK